MILPRVFVCFDVYVTSSLRTFIIVVSIILLLFKIVIVLLPFAMMTSAFATVKHR